MLVFSVNAVSVFFCFNFADDAGDDRSAAETETTSIRLTVSVSHSLYSLFCTNIRLHRMHEIAQIKSLNFMVFSAFSKIFNTRSSDTVTHCMQMFDCDNIESTCILLKRRTKFMRKFTEGVFGDVFG